MTLLIALTLFVLAVFLGLELITKVPATLHTPLMSGSNAVSGITLIGALVSAGADHTMLTTTLGFVAVTLATINVVGGFLVTNRMLAMFAGRKKRRP
ncbi:MAG TPA: NAD(P) transhydrogenase subunit alpha [Acidimicrobiia bacterium]|jgi:NAD(P) transhydrogenase subunit alpha|nr:NAD(P) transhydrogenase subunit alpha [Acidimicrobiales bacterium]RUA26232.1 MAG: NAD(P) transhydrogenase subunit alpha [Actinomycetota bacterium]HBL08016.1 NAD(P) transhydrogenase subunit alpha [Acidimicrobiaceae bacterium]HIM65065.1 NAD(P) transhydrogenase subunit alpha [Acidimicrobiia bacterium]HIM85485.1 NAD(P) transhydrogenase subunit alpha [Acidimicrobiia bacterium]